MSGRKGTDTPAAFCSEAAARIEHEIGTALTAMRGYLKLLLSEAHGRLNPEQWSFAAEARRSTERVELLLANLMALATNPSSDPTPQTARKPLALRDCLERAEASAWPLLEERGVRVAYDLEPDLDLVLGDPDAIERVFVNLLSNAVKFAPEGSRIRIAISAAELARGAVVCVSVADEGPGVDAALAERIFEPFFRGESSAQGAGLGLTICRRIVESHGGSIEAVPGLGYGLFRVELPAAVEE